MARHTGHLPPRALPAPLELSDLSAGGQMLTLMALHHTLLPEGAWRGKGHPEKTYLKHESTERCRETGEASLWETHPKAGAWYHKFAPVTDLTPSLSSSTAGSPVVDLRTGKTLWFRFSGQMMRIQEPLSPLGRDSCASGSRAINPHADGSTGSRCTEQGSWVRRQEPHHTRLRVSVKQTPACPTSFPKPTAETCGENVHFLRR